MEGLSLPIPHSPTRSHKPEPVALSPRPQILILNPATVNLSQGAVSGTEIPGIMHLSLSRPPPPPPANPLHPQRADNPRALLGFRLQGSGFRVWGFEFRV